MRRVLGYTVAAALLFSACDKGAERDESVQSANLEVASVKPSEGGAAPVDEEMVAAQAEPMMADAAPSRSRPSAKMKRAMPMPSSPPPPEPTADNEKYEEYGTNPWTDSSQDALSTFSIDVDTGSYTITRKKLMEQEVLPDPKSVRVEEFVNYFRYDYPNPKSTFGVHTELAKSPFSADGKRYIARIGVQGKRMEAKSRKPTHLTFLVDVSGSMNAADKLPLAVDALKVLVNNLHEGDTVAIATYAGYVSRVLEPTGIDNRGAIFAALDSLGAGGGTGMNDGMKLAYELAMSKKKPGEVSRVIVLSDGDANIGPKSHEDILAGIKGYLDEGVTLSTIGLGTGNYNDKMMEQLANKGNGNYSYIDSIQEARKVFGEQLDGTLQVIAKDVKIQVEFDPVKVPRYRLIGYENRNIADKDFRNDKVDAGEIGAGHTVTALYEIELAGKPSGKLATIRVRHKTPDAFKATEDAFPMTADQIQSQMDKASPDFQFATAVAAFAEMLRNSPHAESLNYDWISEVASAGTKDQADRKEFLQLVRAASQANP